jgi:uncharacterized protein involved in exopolysaccharide biosynthesis
MTSIQSAVKSIGEAFGVIRRHRALIGGVFCVLMVPTMLVVSKIPRTYTATANVLIVNGNSRNDPTLSSPDLPSIVGSTVVLEHVQHDLGISTPLLTMKKQLTAKPPAYRSGIMRIQYTDSNRDRAASVANGIADELARYYTELSTARYDDDLRALDNELAKQKRRLEDVDAQLRAQGGDRYLPTDEKDGDASGSQLSALESQRALANADLQGDIAQAHAAAIDSRRNVLLGDTLYQQLQASLTKASAELAEARSRYTAEYPGLPDLQNRVDSLKAAVAREADRALSSPQTYPRITTDSSDETKAQASVETDRAKVTALDEELANENKRLSVASNLELLRLARDEAVREYQSIAARRATSLADRADALSLGSVEVVDRAIPSEEQTGIGPIRLTLTVALVMALIAIGSAFVADQLDPSLRRVAQIEGLYGKPLIAILRASHRDTE